LERFERDWWRRALTSLDFIKTECRRRKGLVLLILRLEVATAIMAAAVVVVVVVMVIWAMATAMSRVCQRWLWLVMAGVAVI
jgi:hypothetical protein